MFKFSPIESATFLVGLTKRDVRISLPRYVALFAPSLVGLETVSLGRGNVSCADAVFRKNVAEESVQKALLKKLDQPSRWSKVPVL
jgi:hypothetical protein